MTNRLLGSLFKAHRNRLCGPDAYPLHDHNFAEIFWVDEGRGWQFLNGKRIELEPGDCFFLRPKDCHSLHTPSRKPMLLMNIAFQWSIYKNIERRYFPQSLGPISESYQEPGNCHLSLRQMESLRSHFITLLRSPSTLIHIECFLLNLFTEICTLPDSEPPWAKSMPGWLRSAWSSMQNPDRLKIGVSEFYRLCGRCPEHCAREFRRWTGQTPVARITALRMEYAAAMLAGTKKEILDVMAECGFESLSHFYHCFRRSHGVSPAVYRRVSESEILLNGRQSALEKVPRMTARS